MSDTVDDLYARWQRNPADAGVTVALCDALRSSQRPDLVDVVGSHASRQLDVNALLAAARMYSDTGRLDDAQSVLVAAGRLAPRDGDVYRWLGEVLLRRGDAERAEKVLERAVQFGARDARAPVLLDRARALLPTQRSSGMMAVAQQVAVELASMADGNGNGRPPPPQDDLLDDIETQVREGRQVRAAIDEALSRPPPARGLPPPAAPPPPPQRSLPRPAAGRPLTPSAEKTNELPRLRAESVPDLDDDGVFRQTTNAVAHPPAPAFAAGGPASGPQSGSANLPLQRAVTAPHGAGFAPPPGLRAPEPPVPQNPLLAPRRPSSADGQPVPEPRDVLEALQVAGVFEPEGAVKPDANAWESAPKGNRRIGSFAVLVSMAVLFVGGSVGTFAWVRDQRAKAHVEAEKLLAKVDADLRASDPALLEGAEKDLARSFELESRSPHAALSWARERAMLGLLKGGESLAFEDATARAKETGIPDRQIAFASVASFLFQGDTAGAAAALAKWDPVAQEDATYQLVAGATFERAGDARAIERYAAAAKLDPELFLAKVLLARATAVDGDPRRAAEIAKEIRAAAPSRPEGAAVVALAWARDPRRGEPPPDVKEIAAHDPVLPAPLKAVPHAVRAILALEQHKLDDAKPELQKGLALADTPGVASWLGGIALSTGDEALARKAALAAVSYSAVYPPARVLAARVALLGARLDEAAKAAEELPPSSPDVAVVAAAVAYEKVDAERMSRALEPVPDEGRRLPFVVPLLRGAVLLEGRTSAKGSSELTTDKLLDMADDDAPWADLVAMDQALDAGDLETASKIAGLWTGNPRSLRALRLSRLARYQGKADEAEKLSRAAFEGGTVTPRVLAERIFALAAAGKPADAVALFRTHPNAGGPATKWLRAYALASNGENDKAKSAIAGEDAPKEASMPVRTWAVMAYGAVRDARHGGELARSVVASGVTNPDVTAAAEKLGLGKVAVPRRR